MFLHCAHLLEERLRSRLSSFGVQPRQALVLDALGRMGQASKARLARQFGLTAASMSTMTSRLLAAGWIEKQIDERELRSNVLTLSEHGKGLLENIQQQWLEMDRELGEVIGVEGACHLTTYTCQLRTALGGSTPGSAPGL